MEILNSDKSTVIFDIALFGDPFPSQTLTYAFTNSVCKNKHFPNSGHFPLEKSKIQFKCLAHKGSREAFFSLCSQYVLRELMLEVYILS